MHEAAQLYVLGKRLTLAQAALLGEVLTPALIFGPMSVEFVQASETP